MFTTGVRTWAAPNVKEAPKVAPPAAGNRQTTSSRTAGATGAEPTAQKLAFGGTRRKGGKRSKQRRVTRRQRRH
jgi:hypothetical protein